jgi:carbon dioxide concentrating mechanism protein CcmL
MKKSREFLYESSKRQDPSSREASSSNLWSEGNGLLVVWNLEFLWSLDVGIWSFFRLRMGTVIGRVTLSVAVPALEGGRFLIVSPFTREHFQHGTETPSGMSKDPTPVVYDNLGGGVGQTIGFTEGAEATAPFDRPTPIDAINVALVDEIFYSPFKK